MTSIVAIGSEPGLPPAPRRNTENVVPDCRLLLEPMSIVTLSPEAHHRALELTRTSAVDVEYWPTVDPTDTEGSREQKLEAYRAVRDQLLNRIRTRFAGRRPGNE